MPRPMNPATITPSAISQLRTSHCEEFITHAVRAGSVMPSDSKIGRNCGTMPIMRNIVMPSTMTSETHG